MANPIQAHEIVVRAWQSADATSLHDTVRASLPELREWLPWAHSDYARADSDAWIAHAQNAWATRSEFPMGVFDARSGDVLGGVGINQISRAHRGGNLGYWVASAHTGRGIARHAAMHAVRFGFAELGLQRIEIIMLPANGASRAVAEAIGAQREGLARHRIHFDNAAHDAWVYGVIPADLEGAAAAAC